MALNIAVSDDRMYCVFRAQIVTMALYIVMSDHK